MKIKAVLAISLFTFSISSFANIAIECGKGLDENSGLIAKREFLISSEDEVLSGNAGKQWQLYNAKDKEIRNATLKSDLKKNLLLFIKEGQAIDGDVGVLYIITNPRSNNFVKATKKIVGGFAGGTVVGELDCVVTEL